MTAVAVKEVSIAHDGVIAAENISFELERGECLAIVGENGSGKSTLIRGIAGICPLEKGSVIFGGGRRRAGYLPQTPKERFDFPASVDEVVLSGRTALLGLSPFFRAADKKAAERYMKKLDILDLRHRPYSGLSGGERRRVLLARAFCASDDLLLLDEPTAGLDPLIACEFYRLLRGFREETAATIIMVSHDLNAAVENADKILHLAQTVKFFGPAREYRASELGRHFWEHHAHD